MLLDYQLQLINGDLKWTLRQAYSDVLPIDFREAKHGFNVPIDEWLKNEWSDMVDEAFSPSSYLYKLGLISQDAHDIALHMLSDTERLNGHTIFCFVMLNRWLTINLT